MMSIESPAQSAECPACNSEDVTACIRLPSVPVYCNVLHAARDAALAAPKGDMDLVFCRDCGHLFNAAFDPARVDYSAEYENSLHYSGRFQEYAESLARHLAELHDLRGKTVIEIACGQGDFLALLCSFGGSKGVGFDPGHVPGRSDSVGAADLTFVPDYYSESYSEYDADLICCRHALEHIQRPAEFLSMLRRAIGNRRTAIFFEVPNVLYTLRDLGIWDLIYEHCGYFSEDSLRAVFEPTGFRVERVETEFGGQFLGLHGYADQVPASRQSPVDTSGLAALVEGFSAAYGDKVRHWRGRLRDMRAQGRRAVLWGAGSKGVTFMNVLEVRDEVECLIDLNPHKQGRYIPGTGHQVRSPETLAASKPDAVIVMNPLYRDEIAADLRGMGVAAEILVDGAV